MNMPFSAGFAAVDITPKLGVKKIGWLADITIESILDPISARAAVFDGKSGSIGLISLDLLSIRWTEVERIRRGIEAKFGFPGNSILVCATHNHGGPASIGSGPVKRDDAYVDFLVERCVEVFGLAMANRQPAIMRRGSAMEFDVAFNRRTITRDGLVRSQISYSKNPDALFQEGPSDSELGAWFFSSQEGQPLGAMVQFSCHPIDHGGDRVVSDGFPGALCRRIEAAHAPVCLFLNGAFGNVINRDFQRDLVLSLEETADKLYSAFGRALETAEIVENPEVGSVARSIELPVREISEDEYHGRVPGAQRFRDDVLYESAIDRVR